MLEGFFIVNIASKGKIEVSRLFVPNQTTGFVACAGFLEQEAGGGMRYELRVRRKKRV